MDDHTTRQEGYEISQRKRKQIEEGSGWLKVAALLRKIHLRGTTPGGSFLTFGCAVHDLLRISNVFADKEVLASATPLYPSSGRQVLT